MPEGAKTSNGKTANDSARLTESGVIVKTGAVLGTGRGPREAPPPAIHSRLIFRTPYEG
jgi:hypothetical protein